MTQKRIQEFRLCAGENVLLQRFPCINTITQKVKKIPYMNNEHNIIQHISTCRSLFFYWKLYVRLLIPVLLNIQLDQIEYGNLKNSVKYEYLLDLVFRDRIFATEYSIHQCRTYRSLSSVIHIVHISSFMSFTHSDVFFFHQTIRNQE